MVRAVPDHGQADISPAKGRRVFNKTFVNAKFDAEKGEGVDVAKRYSVKAYPTFLILDSDGEEVGRIVGGADADRFIEEVRKVLENIER